MQQESAPIDWTCTYYCLMVVPFLLDFPAFTLNLITGSPKGYDYFCEVSFLPVTNSYEQMNKIKIITITQREKNRYKIFLGT